MAIRQHKLTGWTRESLADMSSRQRITPTDDSGIRIVRFLSAGSWQNDPQDDRATITQDRVVLVDGPPLPDWAIAWLDTVNRKQNARGREAFRAALDDADWNESRRIFGDD